MKIPDVGRWIRAVSKLGSLFRSPKIYSTLIYEKRCPRGDPNVEDASLHLGCCPRML